MKLYHDAGLPHVEGKGVSHQTHCYLDRGVRLGVGNGQVVHGRGTGTC